MSDRQGILSRLMDRVKDDPSSSNEDELLAQMPVRYDELRGQVMKMSDEMLDELGEDDFDITDAGDLDTYVVFQRLREDTLEGMAAMLLALNMLHNHLASTGQLEERVAEFLEYGFTAGSHVLKWIAACDVKFEDEVSKRAEQNEE